MHNLQYSINKEKKQDIFFFSVLVFAAAFLFWKCRYGFANVDESFYLTIPYRLLQGDGLFLDEWHLSQMAGILTLPVVALYVAVTSGTEGIILAMRYFCTAVQCLLAVFFYFRLRKIHWPAAVIAALSFVLYIPFGIMALSYNSMGIMCLLLSQVILLTAKHHIPLQYSIAGLSFAAAVLCCPYLMILYFLYIFVSVVRTYRRRQETASDLDYLTVKGVLYFTMGAALLALVFAVFVLSRSSLSAILQSFPAIMSDPEHLPAPRFEKTKLFFRSIWRATPVSGPVYIFLAVLAGVCLIDKKRQQRKCIYTILAAAATLVMMYFHQGLINHRMWSINLFALFLLLLTGNTAIRRIFVTLWIPGILYAFFLNIASNQDFHAISSASAVSAVGSIMIIGLFACELRNSVPVGMWKKAALCIMGILFAFQIGSQAISRYHAVFWESEMKDLTVHVEEGIDKGLIVSEDRWELYRDTLKTSEEVNAYGGDSVLYLSTTTWYYLQSESRSSTYSAWLSGVEVYTLDRLQTYFDINPKKIPDVVYIENQYQEVAEEYCRKFSYRMTPVTNGYVLLPQ